MVRGLCFRSNGHEMVTDFFGPIFMLPKVRVELTRGHPPHRFLSLERAILISRLIVLTNV